MRSTTLVLLAIAPVIYLPFTHRNSPTPRKHLVETMGGGVALLDYNGDGLLDIFLVNSGYLPPDGVPGPSFDSSNPLYWNRLYRQNANGTFTDVTAQPVSPLQATATTEWEQPSPITTTTAILTSTSPAMDTTSSYRNMATAPSETSRPKRESPPQAGPSPPASLILITTACSISLSHAT